MRCERQRIRALTASCGFGDGVAYSRRSRSAYANSPRPPLPGGRIVFAVMAHHHAALSEMACGSAKTAALSELVRIKRFAPSIRLSRVPALSIAKSLVRLKPE